MDDYVQPENVTTPQTRWKFGRVICNTGKGGWSLVEGEWNHKGTWNTALGLRWNGEGGKDKGHPTARGRASWFIVPDELAEIIWMVLALKRRGRHRR